MMSATTNATQPLPCIASPLFIGGCRASAKAGGSVGRQVSKNHQINWLSPLPPSLVSLDSPPINRGAAKQGLLVAELANDNP
ncbi:MAG: hypothetical protein FD163_603 [Hyphomonadaceae bacterium]|nr:MAG: hypothetical protein FD128_1732 [Hyphomonadaceae bacterium]KAF0185935.1 MAG: hypothetical protein FD163_603 [Hyphomonadaceae bacterium]